MSVLIVCSCTVSAFAQNKVVFDNQSGEPALVKLIGPTQTEVEVPNGAKVGADAAAGRYIIKVRYGIPGKYQYAKGQEFEVKKTVSARSETTITLHKVIAGNYDSRPIPESEFGLVAGPTTRVKSAPVAPSGAQMATPVTISWERNVTDPVLLGDCPNIRYEYRKGTGTITNVVAITTWALYKDPEGRATGGTKISNSLDIPILFK